MVACRKNELTPNVADVFHQSEQLWTWQLQIPATVPSCQHSGLVAFAWASGQSSRPITLLHQPACVEESFQQ